MLARVAKYMMCNRQVEAVKPFREPFKVIPRRGNRGNKSPQQAVLRQEILQKLGRQRLDRTFEVLRGRSVPKFKVYDANNELLIAQRTQVNPMLTESNDSQKNVPVGLSAQDVQEDTRCTTFMLSNQTEAAELHRQVDMSLIISSRTQDIP